MANKKIFSAFAFFGMMVIGVSLLLSVFGLTAFKALADVIAFTVTAIVAYIYVKTKGKLWVTIVYIVSLVLGIVLLVWPYVEQLINALK